MAPSIASKKELVMWTHESTTSASDAILNDDLLSDFDRDKCVLELCTKVSTGLHSPSLTAKNSHGGERRLVISPIALSSEIRKKTPNLQLSLLSHIATIFSISPRSIVAIEAVPKEAHVADYMVLYFKDQYISRADMWKAACNLEGQCIYVGKRITFTGGIRADVREIWRGGKKKLSAYVSANTKPVFRSESARYLIFIQMSKEMWEFEEDGELFYNKAIDGFLPDLFKKWRTMNAHHLVSIVLFTRVNYTGVAGPFCLPRTSAQSDLELYQMRSVLEKPYYNDFYKVVVDNVSSHHWESTLTELKRELHGFARDVLRQKRHAKSDDLEDLPQGTISTAMQGNVLEAINLAAHQFNRDYIDRDLLRTGTSMLFVTAGTGVFEVDERLLRLTGECLLGNGIGMDIVCLSRRPLHMVPLFRYTRSQHDNPDAPEYEYVLPYICEISYYGESRDCMEKRFRPRLKLHELQMKGRRDENKSNIEIDYLNNHIIFKGRELSKLSSGLDTRLDLYDEMCFASKAGHEKILRAIDKDRLTSETPGQEVIELLGTSVPSSGEKQNFKSLYEHSKNTSTTLDALDFPVSRSKLSGMSTESVVSSISIDSGPHSLGSAHDVKTTSPFKSRSTFSRFMHKLSDKSENHTVATGLSSNSEDESPPVRKIEYHRPMLMTLKAKPSLASITGAVTVSSALNQVHKTVVTTGFTTTDGQEGLSSSTQEAQETAAIPIRSKDLHNLSSSMGDKSRKVLTSVDAREARAQSVSQGFQASLGLQSLTNSRSRTSLAVKYKPEKAEAPDASPWHVLINPSYPSKNSSTMNVKAWRWAHVSDRARRSGDMNWESMCAPAALPLTTTSSVDLEDLKSAKYSENSYSIYIGHDNQPLTHKQLLHEMIGQRLVQGYQIAQLAKGSLVPQSADDMYYQNGRRRPLQYGPLGEMGQTVYLTHAQMEVHCITCDPSRESIDVTFFVRKRDIPRPYGYSSLIWQLAQDDGYDDSVVVFRALPMVHNWNYVDQMICGIENRFTDSVRFWRARFLLIPNDQRDRRNPPPIAGGSEQFTEEEIRVAGINKICELIEKSTYLTPKDLQARRSAQKPIAGSRIAVTFTTLEPAAYVAHEIHHYAVKADESKGSQDNKQKLLNTADLSLYDLSNELQSAKGIVIKDRLWHWRWHESSWVGSDLVTWLLERTELTSREEATVVAQKYMAQGLFEHVQQKHGFLDGFYLYRLKADFTAKTAKSWFGTRKVTPNPAPVRARAISNVSAGSKSASNAPAASVQSPIIKSTGGKTTFELSQWLEIDIDLHKKSHRPEFVSLHYDNFYNPETCFHIRLEWISVTAKLVEETVQYWARISEKYGLNLVEVPVDEAFAVTASNPFRAPLSIELCLEPPPANPEESDIVTSAERELWLAKILKHWNFVLDQEAAHAFPTDINVTYSWGKPSYRYTQYIHRSGMSLCQITPTGYLWLTNRLYVSRVAGAPTMVSLPSPVRAGSSINASEPDHLRNSFQEWCHDPDKLRHFFDQGLDSDQPHASALVDDRSSRPRKSSADDRSSIRSAAASQ